MSHCSSVSWHARFSPCHGDMHAWLTLSNDAQRARATLQQQRVVACAAVRTRSISALLFKLSNDAKRERMSHCSSVSWHACFSPCHGDMHAWLKLSNDAPRAHATLQQQLRVVACVAARTHSISALLFKLSNDAKRVRACHTAAAFHGTPASAPAMGTCMHG
jgi:hypothetical protein